ncbi:hypothetical protein OZ677_001576 [Yersinia enterocolitica]|uniref:hypothetical protein n=1 Tax=Yersinia enterocolitica TaxID=630 RepID=UPI00387BC2ED|nr:hypothetical protein [Yersinia enterocolitica]EKN3505268.1 hypothetical protein [Yersinia enterocolitica]EKN4048084.1 hypothetical protein [Yersinia enterocolitica]EKN4760237.1 hypothetical protein [Yersinia enterocolitica]EKN4855790.1 hypothetical protein [Yersinia enterocolitica]
MDNNPNKIAHKKISKVLTSFLDSMESIEESLPSIMGALKNELDEKNKLLNEYIDTNATFVEEGADDGNKKFTIPIKNIKKFKGIVRSHKKSMRVYRIVPRNFLVSIVSEYDAFLGDLIKTILIKKPEILNAAEKQLTFSEIVSFNSIDEIKEYILEKEVESLLRKSHLEQIKSLESKFNLTLRDGLMILPEFVELTERRNLFVHTQGVVSTQYIKLCGEYKCLGDYKIGDTLGIREPYMMRSIAVLSEFAIKLAHVLWNKTFPNEVAEIGNNLVNLSFDLLTQGKYDLVIETLSLFTTDKFKHKDEQLKRILLVNQAIAYKMINEKNKCEILLQKYDWSVVSNLFKCAERILLDDYDEGAIHLKKAIKSEEIDRDSILDWPLFINFRESQQFQNIMEEFFEDDAEEVVTLNDTTSSESV